MAKKSAPKKPITSSKTLDPKSVYERLLPRTRALSAVQVPVARFSADAARVNVDRAWSAIGAHVSDIKKVAPKIDTVRLAELPALARALVYAERLVPHNVSDGSIASALREVAPIRKVTLDYLEIAAVCGLVDAGRVRKIRQGTGKLDLANDAVAIAGLFEDTADALAHKHPFTPQQLATLRERGAWLVEVLKPSGAPKDPKNRTAADLVKDRLAKLLEDDYAELLKAAVALWGVDGYAKRVPALHAHAVKPKLKPPKVKPPKVKPPPADAGAATKT